jgi:hypothetical protein
LHWAGLSEQVAVVKKLLNKGIRVETSISYKCSEVLTYILPRGDDAIAKVMFEHGFRVVNILALGEPGTPLY